MRLCSGQLRSRQPGGERAPIAPSPPPIHTLPPSFHARLGRSPPQPLRRQDSKEAAATPTHTHLCMCRPAALICPCVASRSRLLAPANVDRAPSNSEALPCAVCPACPAACAACCRLPAERTMHSIKSICVTNWHRCRCVARALSIIWEEKAGSEEAIGTNHSGLSAGEANAGGGRVMMVERSKEGR